MAGTATPGYATQQEAYQALLQAGASPDVAQILAAVTRPESSGYTSATNNYQGNQYLGLWQIGSFHGFDNARLRSDDILYQAQAALQVYNQQGFNAWQTYSNGSYKQYLDQTPTALALAHLNQITYSQPTASLTPQQRQAAGLPLDNFARIALGLPWQNGVLAAANRYAQAQGFADQYVQENYPLPANNPAAAPGEGQTAIDAPGTPTGAANPIGPPGQNTARGNPIDSPVGFDSTLTQNQNQIGA